MVCELPSLVHPIQLPLAELPAGTAWLNTAVTLSDFTQYIGLVDEGETPEQAAIRELQEETGFKADKVLETSTLMVSDPGMLQLDWEGTGISSGQG